MLEMWSTAEWIVFSTGLPRFQAWPRYIAGIIFMGLEIFQTLLSLSD